MKSSLYKKSIVFAILVVLIGAVAIPSISGNNITKSNNTVNPQPTGEILFFDDFNDNSKDMTLWTESDSHGTWWERNQQTEFRLYESGGSNRNEGIISKNIPVSLDEPLVIECIMDTLVECSWGNYIGQPHIRIVNTNDDSKWIDVYYRRDINQIFVIDSEGTSMSIGTTDEFRFKVTITIQPDNYNVEVGPYTSGYISQSIFPEECGIQVRLYIRLAGDYPSEWWCAGFDDVIVNGKKRSKNAYSDIDIPRFLNNFPILQKLLLQLLGL